MGKEMADDAYQDMQDLYDHLAYTQIRNIGDETDNGEKVHFKMPKED